MAAQTKPTNGTIPQREVYEGVSITEFKNNTRTVRVKWFERELRVEYRPGKFDDEHYKHTEENAIGKEGKQHEDWLRAYFLDIVHSVPSLTLDDGSPFLITEDTIPMLPIPLKNMIVNAIAEDMVPKEESASESKPSSSPAADGG